MINNIIKLNYETDFSIIDVGDYNIKFLGRKKDYRDILESIQIINEMVGSNPIDDDEIIKNYLISDRFNIEYLDYIKEAIENEDIEEANNCKFGTVGYSPWSYYIAYKDIEHSFINDLYEGYNWYTLQLLSKNGDILESIGFYYIPNDEALKDYVLTNFGLSEDDFFLVDNEESKYMNIKKVKGNFTNKI